MHYYITKSNFLRITTKYEPGKINDGNIFTTAIPFFNKLESLSILSVKQFLFHSKDELFEFNGTGYVDDSYTFVNEEPYYAKYHQDRQCQALFSSFKGINIPTEIRVKQGSDELDYKRIEQFREWFKTPEIEHMYHADQKKFLERMQLKFNLSQPLKVTELASRGVQGISTLTKDELENQINALISKANAFYQTSDVHRTILLEKGFSKKTFLVTAKKYRECKIEKNDTGYTDDKVREILVDFYIKIKKPCIDSLIDYWIVCINPNLVSADLVITSSDGKIEPIFCNHESGAIHDSFQVKNGRIQRID